MEKSRSEGRILASSPRVLGVRAAGTKTKGPPETENPCWTLRQAQQQYDKRRGLLFEATVGGGSNKKKEERAMLSRNSALGNQ